MIFRRWILLTTIALTAGCTAVPAVKPPPLPPPPTTAQAGSTTVVAVAPPAQPCCKMTLPEWLGITGLFRGIGRLLAGLPPILNYVLPGVGTQITELATVAPPLPLNAAANLTSPNPAVRTAAEIKQEEDGSAQKIKALEYLATIGCSGCYPGTEAALLAGLEDCTEAVRFAAVKGLSAAAGQPCRSCQARNCCSVKVMAKLHQLGYEANDQGCYVESSPRVRRLARLAMTSCGGQIQTPDPGPPLEGPSAVPQPAAPISIRASQVDSRLADAAFGPPASENVPIDVAESESAPAGRGTLATVVSDWLQRGERSVDDIQLAWINDEPIQVADLQPMLDEFRSRLPAEQPAAVRGKLLTELVRVELERVIDRKLLCQAARAAAAGGPSILTADYSQDAQDGVLQTAGAIGAIGPQEEDDLAAEWLRRQVRIENAVTEDDVREHFRMHFARYGDPGQVRFERVSAKFERFANEEEARAALAVVQQRIRGETIDPAAASQLRGVTSATVDWTRRDTMASEAISTALLNLPIGKPGEIIADQDGLHILRVLERQPANPFPSAEAAERIRADLRRLRYHAARREYLRSLRQQASIRTIDDSEADVR